MLTVQSGKDSPYLNQILAALRDIVANDDIASLQSELNISTQDRDEKLYVCMYVCIRLRLTILELHYLACRRH